MKTSNIISFDIDITKTDQAITELTKLALDHKSNPKIVIQPHVEFLEQALKKVEIMQLFQAADYRFANGIPLQWAAYWQNLPRPNFINLVKSGLLIMFKPNRIGRFLPQTFNSQTFTWPLLESCAQHGLRVYLIGSPHYRDITYTADYLRQRIPGLTVVGVSPGRDQQTGEFSAHLEQQITKDLQAKRPDIILVGLGFPRQEKLMKSLKTKLNHGIMIAEGGTFDYRQFGGRKPRAPKFVQNAGLEWLWRLLREPRRFKRQLAIPRFIIHVYRQSRLN